MRRFLIALLLFGFCSTGGTEEPDPKKQPEPEPPDLSTAKATLTLNPVGHIGPIQSVFFTADGKQLVSVGRDRTVQFWDVGSGERVRVLHMPAVPTAAALTRDGKTLALGRWATKGQPKVFLVNFDNGRVLSLIG